MKNAFRLKGEQWIKSQEKRELDMTMAVSVLPLAVPIGSTAIVLSRLIDGKGAIFSHERIRPDGDTMMIHKIRTMREKTEDDEGQSPLSRITWFGGKLRPLAIDEIPQLVHILQGSMSVVGPRLLMQETISDMQAAVPRDVYDEWLESYCHSKPGGISSFHIANRTSRYNEAELAQKAHMDIEDFKNASFRHDVFLVRKAVSMGLRQLTADKSQIAAAETKTGNT